MDELNKQTGEEVNRTAQSVEAEQEDRYEAREEICPEPGEAEFSGGAEHLEQDESAGNTGTDESVSEEVRSPEVLALEEEKKSLIERLSRLQADFNNYRRRVEQEKEDLRERAHADLLTALLPVLDNFERAQTVDTTASDNFVKGVELIYRQLQNLLEKEGVTVIETEGKTLDPHLHHAVMKEAGPEGVAEDTIIGVMQKGYLFKERVLRPAMVKVAE